MLYSAMRMRTPLVKAFGRFRAAAAVGAPKSAAAFTNITYSGGHASEGQVCLLDCIFDFFISGIPVYY